MLHRLQVKLWLRTLVPTPSVHPRLVLRLPKLYWLLEVVCQMRRRLQVLLPLWLLSLLVAVLLKQVLPPLRLLVATLVTWLWLLVRLLPRW
jgi:hypothetical protein